MPSNRAPWVIVLAGGVGSRLATLTTDARGVAVPKQYCSLRGGPSLLLETLERAYGLTAPDRVLVVVAAEHAAWWRNQLSGVDPTNVLVQPQNRGTGAGVLLPLAVALARDPRATVVVMPSDHYFARPASALQAMRSSLHAVAADPTSPVLLGMPADRADPEYGWIVADASSSPPWPIRRFFEKPSVGVAHELLQRGACWNSFLLVAVGEALWALAARHLPVVVGGLAGIGPAPTPTALERAYRGMPVTDFSYGVLEAGATSLRVWPVPPCGWTDLGTPQRVLACLAAAGDRAPASREASALRPIAAPAAVVLARAAERVLGASPGHGAVDGS
jgi:mannose-1-phosphate guanylyltransferase